VGSPKASCCKRFFQEIAPWVEIEDKALMFGKDDETDDLILGGELALFHTGLRRLQMDGSQEILIGSLVGQSFDIYAHAFTIRNNRLYR
jgi:hypothetical protein